MKTMKFIKTKIGTALPFLLLPLCAVLLPGCSSLPKDNANVQVMHFENLNATRYAEFFLVGGNGITGNLEANVYNTLALNGYTESNKDSAPQALAEAFNPELVKKEYHVLGAKLNGPKRWMLDWIDVPMGTERDFCGLKARWCAELNLKGMNLKDESKMSYHPTTVQRKTKFGYNKGTTAHLIDDADGNTWIMKGYNEGLKPAMSFAEASTTLANRLTLPLGWKFRDKVLEQDLVLSPETGTARIMPDNLFNVYDITGPGYSNYKP
jgi:hypothetical protein